MGKSKISNAVRNLEDTSWMAQMIQDKMEIEFEENGPSTRWHCLNIFHIITNEADDPENDRIYHKKSGHLKQIIICEIPDLSEKYGLDFDMNGMQCKLRGLAENYYDFHGNYLVSVVTTHDLNHASINDVNELMFELV
ncbi:MAG TPA: hypothetical protein GX707_06265 [Epulopiscium sp.]|nr:hypothetical protein [Candidatus Epulonipiscium sp.]